MTAVQTSPSTKPKRKTVSQRRGAARRATTPASPTTANADSGSERVTKHDRVLTLLSRRDGATIQDMMEATGWQQHSVRGFLAGTVKKKLGLELTSSKAEGELRCHRVATKSSR